MSIMRKYVYPVFHYAAVFLFGFIPFEVFSLALRTLYTYLTYEFPDIVPDYSPVLNPEEYARVVKVTDMLALTLTVLVLTYIAMRMDNARFEYTVKQTGGLYRIPKTWLKHAREFALSDITVAILIPALFVAPAYLLPEIVMKWGGSIVLWAGVKTAVHADIFTALLYTSAMSVGARLLLTPKVLIDWRAAWLTSSVG